MNVDVLVVGAGPIGSVAARCAAEAGASVLLADRREGASGASACTGLISPRTLKILGASMDCVVREIRAVTVHAPDGRTWDLTAGQVKAVVIDRSRLEQELRAMARRAGADVRLGTEAVAASPAGVVLRSSDGVETAGSAAVVCADGPRSRVARWFGLAPPEALVHAVQAVVEAPDVTADRDRIDVFLGSEVAPGFFAWAVPAERRTLRVGLGVSSPHDPWEHFDRFLAARFSGRRVLSRAGGPIPVAPAPRTAAGPALLVGDAAGQVKPLSGGGLYPGGVCARIVARIAAGIALHGTPSEQAETAYESEWRSAIGREVAFGQSVRQVSSRLSDQSLSELLAGLANPDLLSFLAEHADIDAFHRLPDQLAGQRSLWARILQLAPRIAGREMSAALD